jgi:hypothetical protein
MIGGLKVTVMNALGAVIAFLVRPCFVAHINRQTFLVRKSNKRLNAEKQTKLSLNQNASEFVEGG